MSMFTLNLQQRGRTSLHQNHKTDIVTSIKEVTLAIPRQGGKFNRKEQ